MKRAKTKGGVRPGSGRPLGPLGERALVAFRIPVTLLAEVDAAAYRAGTTRTDEIVGRLKRGKRRRQA